MLDYVGSLLRDGVSLNRERRLAATRALRRLHPVIVSHHALSPTHERRDMSVLCPNHSCNAEL